jgi:hypothetical protein
MTNTNDDAERSASCSGSGGRPSLAFAKSFLDAYGRLPNAIEYADAGFGTSGQCLCRNVGECPVANIVTTDRNCYADQLRDAIAIANEADPDDRP